MTELTHENVSMALKHLQTLRVTTNHFWMMLFRGKNDQFPYRINGEDVNDANKNTEHNNDESSNKGNNQSKDNTKEESDYVSDKRKIDRGEYLKKLRNILNRETENSFSNLPNTPLPIPIISTTLLKDPLAIQSNISQHTINNYKWFSKMHDQCLVASVYLNTHLSKRATPSSNSLIQRSRKTTIGYNCSPATLDQLIKQISHHHHLSDIFIIPHKPSGPLLNPIILEIRVGQVMKAMVCLRGLCIENVVIKAIHEDFTKPHNKKHDFDSPSRYEVFQMITDHAHSILLNFNTYNPDSTFKQFLMWLNSYRSLFSQPCSRCHKLLRNMLPPTWKDYPSYEPTHLLCLKG